MWISTSAVRSRALINNSVTQMARVRKSIFKYDPWETRRGPDHNNAPSRSRQKSHVRAKVFPRSGRNFILHAWLALLDKVASRGKTAFSWREMKVCGEIVFFFSVFVVEKFTNATLCIVRGRRKGGVMVMTVTMCFRSQRCGRVIVSGFSFISSFFFSFVRSLFYIIFWYKRIDEIYFFVCHSIRLEEQWSFIEEGSKKESQHFVHMVIGSNNKIWNLSFN